MKKLIDMKRLVMGAASRSWWKNRKGVFSRYPKTIVVGVIGVRHNNLYNLLGSMVRRRGVEHWGQRTFSLPS